MAFLKTHKIEIIVGLLTSFVFEMMIMLWSKGSVLGWKILKESYYITLANMSTFELVVSLLAAFLGILQGIFASTVVFFIRNVLSSKRNEKSLFSGDIKSHRKSLIGIFIVGVAVCILLIVLFTVYILIPATLYGKYQNNLTEIKPYITEAECNQIQSRWVQIRNKDDYEKICKWIETIKHENELK